MRSQKKTMALALLARPKDGFYSLKPLIQSIELNAIAQKNRIMQVAVSEADVKYNVTLIITSM